MTRERRLHALRIVRALQTSSTRPLLVETGSGRFVLKLVNGPDGPRALAAEWLSQRLAQQLGLPTLELAPVILDRALAASIAESELREAVERGAGLCLGSREVPGAVPASAGDLEAASDAFALSLLWLDVLIENPDRRRPNPNILRVGALLIGIDHASSLSFHHDWRVTEETPRQRLEVPPDHVFAGRAGLLNGHHRALRERLDRGSVLAACDSIPVEWLGPLAFESADRQRAAYFAMLWKRLAFMDQELG